ncbi:DUF2642 domain-containing protein [Tumebacillus permanentifrigoris]|uniref:Uncharacterized protein DUF2642 n=1 Tax=Tumebacillus permanentifrigoris TaxID=378543 RepID=A0A316DDM3_9BACL|nr:DUF2642 domain-containing protein [Tumebacillus permanentifrigoris]PWK14890.1 uncharacterized protein DUF2642 [Tumebacillus permanentifrigoris]
MSFDYLKNSVGKLIQVERGGPDKLQGKLLAVKGDHLIVETADGIVYVNNQHIKTISEPILVEVVQNDCAEEDPEGVLPAIIDAVDLCDLLEQLTHKLVKINQNGPNALEGVLLTVHEDAVTIVHNMKDYVHYPLYHIKTITWVINAPVKNDDKKKNGSDGGKKEE